MRNSKIENSYFKFIEKNLLNEYSNFLKASFKLAYWQSGVYKSHRINFENFKEAENKLKKEVLDSPGVYIWGVEKKRVGKKENIPLYIGKTKSSFSKRFSSRYVKGDKAQFALAKKYSGSVKKLEIKEIQQEHQISRARAVGVKYFGESNFDSIWVILIPISNDILISGLEGSLIAVGEQWNKRNIKGKVSLINLLK